MSHTSGNPECLFQRFQSTFGHSSENAKGLRTKDLTHTSYVIGWHFARLLPIPVVQARKRTMNPHYNTPQFRYGY